MMNISALGPIIVTGFTVAFFHAVIPTHWLPFVIASRTQKWSRMKTLLVTALAGAGHVIVTSILGVLVVLLGLVLDEKIGGVFAIVAGSALILLGAFYFYRHFKGEGHEHGHIHLLGEHHHHESVLCFRGEHGGVLLDTSQQLIEVANVFVNNENRLRIYFYDETALSKPPPDKDSVTLKLIKTVDCKEYEEGKAHTEELFTFIQKENFLESSVRWEEIQSFEAFLNLKHRDHSHEYHLKFNSEVEDSSATLKSKENHNPRKKTDRMAIMSLLTLLTFSPCESFLPVYLSGIQYGWFGFTVLSLILGVATLFAMILFTWLALTGIEKLKLTWIEKHESAIMGTALLILGLVVMFFED